MELTPEFAKQSREDASRKYEDEKSKFGIQMMTMSYYKVKSLLNLQGLEKIGIIDSRRNSDEVFNRKFSEQMWNDTEEIWGEALEQLILKIIKAYGLNPEKDLKNDSYDENEKDDNKLEFYE